ncbi:MAG: EamA family transporter RarD [Planctomycetaceae bacterium]|nr:EamA family transporter RarD [Planctomycetaceae bacterium]
MPQSEQQRSLYGLWAAILVYSGWGFFPLYFALLRQVPALNILAFRMVFAFAVLISIVLLCGKGKAVFVSLSRKRPALCLLCSGTLISGNWLVFVLLVQSNRVLESSLGYFINPLISVLFGVVFLRERLRPLTWFCVFLAGCGVSFYAWEIGTLPWGALGVALTFAGYSLLRKLNPATDSLSALTIETLYACLPALAWLLWQNAFASAWAIHPRVIALLIGTGVLTALTFLIFGFAARRIRLSTLGMLQYLTPTFSFLCAVCFLGETMQWFQWIAFVIIWMALLLYIYDSVSSMKGGTVVQRKVECDNRKKNSSRERSEVTE